MQPSLRFALALMILAGLTVPVLAQDEEEIPVGVWQKEFEIGVNMLQSAYSDNWNGGDKGSLNWTGNFRMRLEKQVNEERNWLTRLRLAYGQSHNQERNDNGDLYWKKPDKTEDIIDFESMMRWVKASGWDPYAALGFVSRFDDRSDVLGRSIAFNPMSVKPSAGIAWRIVETDKRKLMTRWGIAYVYNSRSFFVNEVDPEDMETVREGSSEIAADWVTEYKVGALDERVDWHSRLTVSLPFVYTGKSVFEDDVDLEAEGLPADVASYTTTADVDWENTFTADITKVISVQLFIRWVYDKYDNTVIPVVDEGGALVNSADVHQAIRKAGQFKQTLALGFSYKF